MVENQDHGVFSCLFLLNKLIPIIEKISTDTNELKYELEIRKFEIYMAAFAISIHNSLFLNILVDHANEIEFKDFPIEVLLLFCDACQEWGRIKKIKIPKSSSVLDFKKFSFNSFELQDRNGKKVIKIRLDYDGNYETGIFNTLSSYFCSKQVGLVFGDYLFEIEYIFKDDNKRDIRFN